MKKLFLTSIITIAICIPALAATDIASNANSATCTESVLDTTSGTSNLEAKWTANILNLQWIADAEGWTTSNTTCTYDGGIAVPSTTPSKTGYTFAGWTVKNSNNNSNNENNNFLANLDASITPIANTASYREIDNSKSSGLYAEFLPAGYWGAAFSYGAIIGESQCNNTPGPYVYQDENLYYCWCRVIGHTTDMQTIQTVVGPWIYNNDLDYFNSIEDCSAGCSQRCLHKFVTEEDPDNLGIVRKFLYGQINYPIYNFDEENKEILK